MEEKSSVISIVKEFIKQNILFFVLMVLGVVMLIIGFFQYTFTKDTKASLSFTAGEESKLANEVKGTSDVSINISVDVEGKVLKPGVHKIKEGSRVADALIAAGGLSANADREYVSKNLNQAQKVVDGTKIYIPAVGEQKIQTVEVSQIVGTDTSYISEQTQNSGLININSASEGSLDSLPKIGPVTAKKIIAGRPYATIEELVSKKVVTQKAFEGFKDKITAP